MKAVQTEKGKRGVMIGLDNYRDRDVVRMDITEWETDENTMVLFTPGEAKMVALWLNDYAEQLAGRGQG